MNIKPPRKDPEFVKLWNIYIDDVSKRQNFKESHINQLKILIDAMLDYEALRNFVKEHGFSYSADTKYGPCQKKFAEVDLMHKTMVIVKDYCKALDIKLNKDESLNDNEDDDEWE